MMNHYTSTAWCLLGLLTFPYGPSAQEKNALGMLRHTPAKPGYLNNGEPFSLRKAPRRRPPAYALPSLPIVHDPQPLPLKALGPAQPLNPAEGRGQIPVQAATIPLRRVAPIRTITIQARPNFVSRAESTQSSVNSFLNPEILRYFNADSNGTYQSRIRLNGNSLFTLPSMNPLLQRGGSTTYQIK